MTKRFRLVLSAAFAVLTAGLCALYAQEVRAQADAERAEVLERFGSERVQLVVAETALEPGDTVTRQSVCVKEWAGELAPQGAITSLDDVIEHTVTVPVAEGAPLNELNFRDSSELPEVPSGYVAVQVPITDKLGLTTTVPAGARLVAYEVTDDGTRLISGDVQVLVAATSGASGITRGSISVAARPDDVVAMLTSSAEGSLRLVVPADDALVDETAAPTKVEAGEAPAQEGDADAGDADADKADAAAADKGEAADKDAGSGGGSR